MARYGDRKADSSGSSSKSNSPRRGSGEGRSKERSNAEFVTLGDLTISKKAEKDIVDLVDDAMDMEATMFVKVFLPTDKKVTVQHGDRLMVKFKSYEKAPEFSKGKVFLVIDE